MTQSLTNAPMKQAPAAAATDVNGASANGAAVGDADPLQASPGGSVKRERPPFAGLKLGRKRLAAVPADAGLVHALSLLPDFILYPLGVLGGYVGYLVDRRHVKIGMVNLAIAFPDRSESERRRIVRASYINLGRGGAEYMRLAGFFHRRLIERVTYERFLYWNEVKQRNTPAAASWCCSAHFGNFELLATAHALHGHQI